MAEIIRQAKGTSQTWRVELRSASNSTLSYDRSETLSAVLWAGDDWTQVSLTAPTWVVPASEPADDETADTDRFFVRVPITSANLATLAAGAYKLRVYVGSGPEVAAEAELLVEWSPVSATAPAVYCSPEDLRLYWPELESLRAQTDQATYWEQRAEARKWLDNLLTTSYIVAEELDETDEDDAATIETFTDALADDRLRTSTSRDRWIAECTAYYAISLILMSRVDMLGEDRWIKPGEAYRKKAAATVLGRRAFVDVEDDGVLVLVRVKM